MTLWVSFAAFALALGLGLVVALARLSRHRVLREAATFYVEVVRGIPVLVLLFYIAFVGAPQLVALWNWALAAPIGWGLLSELSVRDFNMTWRAIVALMISYSAFIAEIFRAGIEAVPIGQTEAAESLGLRRRLVMRLVVLPQAVRVVIPPLGNDFVAMIKDSALVSALGVQDITQLGKVYSASTFLFFETYNVVAYLYLVMTIGLSLLVRGPGAADEEWVSVSDQCCQCTRIKCRFLPRLPRGILAHGSSKFSWPEHGLDRISHGGNVRSRGRRRKKSRFRHRGSVANQLVLGGGQQERVLFLRYVQPLDPVPGGECRAATHRLLRTGCFRRDRMQYCLVS